jgi:hypothetical protein
MAIVGDWTLHFDWGCTGNYAQVGITFNNDGTFSIPAEGNSGRWVQNDGMILFQYDVQFDTYNTTYGGNLAGNVMAGMSSTFAGLNGCWYAIKVGGTTMRVEERKPEFDTSGKKAKY